MRIVPTLLAAGLILSSSSAFAASKSKDTKPATPSGTMQQSAGAERKYCIQLEALSDSRIYNRQCLTKAQWAKLGVDVDDQAKSN